MNATGLYAVGLYAVALLLTLVLHLARARITLAPLFALGAIETFLIWQLAQTGWWGDWAGVAFNAPLLALLPAILLAAGLVYALDGVRTARAYSLTLAAALAASIAYEEFVRGLGEHMPMPSFFFISLSQQASLACSLLLAVAAVALVYDFLRKVTAAALSLAVAVTLGLGAFLLAYSFLTYGIAVGWRNLRLETGHYALTAIPLLGVALAYGAVAAQRRQFLPARPIAEVFALWRASDQAYQEVRQGFLQARATISELTALTERLQMERQLREYQMQHSPLALLELDSRGCVRGANPAAEQLFGLCPLVSRPIDSLLAGFSRFLAQGASLSEVFEISSPEGPRRIQATVMPIQLLQRLDGYSVIAEDVTLRERAKFKQQVAERVKGIQMTSKVLGHDFANMMLSIEGNLSHIRSVLPSPLAGQLDGNLTAIANAASRGRDMLKQLGTGQPFQLPEPKTQELWPLVAEAVRLQLAAALAAGIQLQPDIQPGIAADIDATQMLRVLINLIGNAVRATPLGGTIAVSLRKDGTGAVITVTDTGSGMTADQLAVAFEPGFSTKSGGQGGLGLAISYLIVDAHGGRLSLESASGKGTTATIWLPLADPMRAEARDLTLLVAVADERVRESIVDALAPLAAELVEVADGEELEAVLAEDPRPWGLAVIDAGFPVSPVARQTLATVCQVIVTPQLEIELVWTASYPASLAQEVVLALRRALVGLGSIPDILPPSWPKSAEELQSSGR